MKVFFQDVEVFTKNRTEVVDITGLVEGVVRKSDVKNGLCLIHSVHSTTAIIVNENEAGLRNDIVKKVRGDYPEGAGWLHDKVDENADAHLASSFIGASRIFPVKDGMLLRGTWQDIFLLELDGPRLRRIMVEVMGE
ncbi:MAG: secondary thiamine-phosphate synthase enzyme YjbQ [Candidatus Bathyarchaeia archaeon]